MRASRTLILTVLVFLIAGPAVSAPAAYAREGGAQPSQPSPGADPLLRQLLEEVHQLRLALQRATVANTRFQMAIERMRIQQAHVDGIRRDLDGVREQISDLETVQSTTADKVKDWEEKSKLETGAERDAAEEELKRIRSAASSIERELQARRGREEELTIRMDKERKRLDDLSDQLDALSEELKKQ
jgi:chromosome segregation ATPase